MRKDRFLCFSMEREGLEGSSCFHFCVCVCCYKVYFTLCYLSQLSWGEMVDMAVGAALRTNLLKKKSES